MSSIEAPVHRFRGPTHSLSADRSRVDAPRTLRDTLAAIPAFGAAIRHRRHTLVEQPVDVMLGFYDALGGVMRGLGVDVPRVVLGHHYLMFHPDAPRLELPEIARWALRSLTRITALGADRTLALSFGPLPDSRDVRVIPPLLRAGLADRIPSDGGHLLVYAVTPGVGDRIVAWQRTRPDVPVLLFVTGGEASLSGPAGPGCTVNDLNGDAFQAAMASCRAYAGSAGFESLCEAHYLGKPVLAVPTPGQIEQHYTAADAERFGVARSGSWDDLDDFWDSAKPIDTDRVRAFRRWADSAPARVVDNLVTLPALSPSP